MTQEERKKLRAGLKKHYGAYKEIAERTGMSYVYVHQVISGRRNNEDVLLAAATLLNEKQKEKREKQEQLKAALAMAEI